MSMDLHMTRLVIPYIIATGVLCWTAYKMDIFPLAADQEIRCVRRAVSTPYLHKHQIISILLFVLSTTKKIFIWRGAPFLDRNI